MWRRGSVFAFVTFVILPAHAFFDPVDVVGFRNQCLEYNKDNETVDKIMETFAKVITPACFLRDYNQRKEYDRENVFTHSQLEEFYSQYCANLEAKVKCHDEFKKLVDLCMTSYSSQMVALSTDSILDLMQYLCNNEREEVIDYIVSRGNWYNSFHKYILMHCIMVGRREKPDVTKDQIKLIVANCLTREYKVQSTK